MITRTIMAIVVGSVALWAAVYWGSLFPIEDPNGGSVAGILASFTMERYTTAAIPAAVMLFVVHQFADGPNPIGSIIVAGLLALALVIPATLMLGITQATDDRSAEVAANFVAYIAVLLACLHSMDVLTLDRLKSYMRAGAHQK